MCLALVALVLRTFHLSILMRNCTVKARNKQWRNLGSLINSLHNCFKICTPGSMSTLSWKTLRKSHRAFVIPERDSTEPSQEESPPGIAKGLMVTLLSPFPGRKYASLTSMPGWCLLSQAACCGRNAICFCLLRSLQTALFSGWMTATPSLARQHDSCRNW